MCKASITPCPVAVARSVSEPIDALPVTNHVVLVKLADRTRAYALAAELRRLYEATFDLQVNRASEGFVVEVPVAIWRVATVPRLVAEYGGRAEQPPGA